MIQIIYNLTDVMNVKLNVNFNVQDVLKVYVLNVKHLVGCLMLI